MVRTGTNEIRFAQFDRRTEPLDQGTGRVMKENLSSVPNMKRVVLSSRGHVTLSCEVAVRILSCEGVRVVSGRSSIPFAAMWEVRAFGTNSMATKRGGCNGEPAAWGGKTYARLARGLSDAIACAGTALPSDLPMEARLPPKTRPDFFKP